MTILDTILKEKQKEVSLLKHQTFTQAPVKKVPSFYETVKASKHLNIISEFKRASPSKGPIQMERSPEEQAKQYELCGASAISVLTDYPFFKGSMKDLQIIREAVNIPILCKDFIIHETQIKRAKAAGANIILLIAAALNDEDLSKFYQLATELDLEVLCEVHNEEEMERVLKLDAKIIGINNRDLKTFTVDLSTTKRLANMVANPETVLISESGISNNHDAVNVAASGADVILVGETLMRANDLQGIFNELQVPLKRSVY